MCWIGRDCPIIAKKNIPVLKIGMLKDNKVFSYFQHFEYEVGKPYYFEITKNPYDFDECSIINGLHSYSMGISIIKLDSTFVSIAYNDRLLEIYSVYGKTKLCKMECIIPKGSMYYENEIGEIVSNSLKIKTIINF